MDGEAQPTTHKSRLPFIIMVVVVILFAAAVYWYLVLRIPTASPAPVVEPPAAQPITSPDLGSELFEKSSNPVSEQLPETVAPIPNPLEGAYENPFGG